MGAGRCGTVKTWNTFLGTGWSPVDWLHAVFELVRWLELPLANDGPDDHNGSYRSGESDENSQGGFCGGTCTAAGGGGASGAGIGGSDGHELCLLTPRLGTSRGGCRSIILLGWSGRRLGGGGRSGG